MNINIKIQSPFLKLILTILISLVWLVNGLFCKVLNFVPRHQIIVSRILGVEYSQIFTITIGIAEVLMAIWIISKIQSRLCTITQSFVVALMNVIEFIVVPDLLLFGRFNIVVACIFIVIILFNEFVLIRVNENKIY